MEGAAIARRASRMGGRWLATTSLGVLALCIAAPASAQTASSNAEVEEIVVTGTLVRGVAPVGTNVSSVNLGDIQRAGASSANQILSTVPQVTNAFNVVPVTPASLGRSTFRPDLRYLGATGGATTLVLMDGHNLVGSGILQTTPDAGAIPTGAIQRVEVLADGGSSIYGSDAIGGIVNFITRNRFDGLEISGHRGFASGYDSSDLSVTAGTDWGSGSAMVSVMGRWNGELGAEDRNLPRQDLRPFGGDDFRSRTCAPGTIIANGTTYALPGRVPGTVNLCDTSILGVITPKEQQYGAFAAVTQTLAPNLEFEVKAFASERTTKLRQAQISDGGAVIDNTNPFFQSIAGETRQSVALDFSSVLTPYRYSTSRLSQWHVTPTLTYRAANDWRVQAMFDYGWSDTEVHASGINSEAEAAALRGAGLTTSTALNPYDLTRTNPTVLFNIANFENYARSHQTLATGRVGADGPLFSTGGGQARLAVGAQYQRQSVDALSVNAPRGVTFGGATADDSRNSEAVFAQLVVPFVGPNNAMPLVESFDLDLSARYDHYSGVGGTTNPKIGANWGLGGGFRVRGNYGTAFQAPSLADSTAAVDTRANIVATTNNLRPGDPASDRNRPTIQLAGGNPKLQPQTADTWSVGFDFDPEFLPGLTLSGTYWSVKIKDSIGIAPAGSPDFYQYAAYAPFYVYRPTLAQAQAITQGMVVTGATSVASLYGNGNDPYILTYQTRQNLGTLWVNGIDASIAYQKATDWGHWYARVAGSWQTKRDTQAVAGTPIADLLAANRPKFQGTATLGGEYGKFSASARVNYTGGFAVTGVNGQTRVDSFMPVNLYMAYAITPDFDLTLNVDNVFNIDPSFLNRSGGTPNIIGFQINSTLGRYFNIGVRKRF